MNDLATRAQAAVIVQRWYRGYKARRERIGFILSPSSKFKSVAAFWSTCVDGLVKVAEEEAKVWASRPAQGSPSSLLPSSKRWRIAGVKAKKISSGSKHDKVALWLAIQHWLEAVDAKHRYGHNLLPYMVRWQASNTSEPFFYWLDHGEGKDVVCPDLPRETLEKQRIAYLTPAQRVDYLLEFKDGRAYFARSHNLLSTATGDKWIFVASPDGKLYCGKKKKGAFQHSSFLSGGAALAAGRLEAKDGVLTAIIAHSGHYKPPKEAMTRLLQVLEEQGVDISKVEVVTQPDPDEVATDPPADPAAAQ
eukprot:jgi/Mesvir1/3613/Mv13027-RA.1